MNNTLLLVTGLGLFMGSQLLAADMVHPICMDRLQSSMVEPANSSEPLTLDLEACQKKNQPIPFTRNSDFSASFSRGNIDNFDSTKLPSLVEYNIIGQLKDHQSVVSISSNYGGTMIQSNVLLVRGLQPDISPQAQLMRNQEITGGDRCFGGIHKVSILSPETIEIERNLTTDGLLNLDKNKEQFIDGVSACAICCVGVVREQHTLGKAPEIINVELSHQTQSNDTLYRQGCFNKLTGKFSPENPLKINLPAVKDIQQRFQKDCIEKP